MRIRSLLNNKARELALAKIEGTNNMNKTDTVTDPRTVAGKLDAAFAPDIRVQLDANCNITAVEAVSYIGANRLARKSVLGQNYDVALFGDLAGLTIESN